MHKNLLLFTDFVLKEIKKGNQVDVLFADFSKAFDRIPHDKLIGKLTAFGFAPLTIRWLASYLTGRKQSVRIGSHDSTLFDVTLGVPQGSHIGPALFIIYVNDISGSLTTANHLLFADDTKIYSIVNTSADAANFKSSITDLSTWSDDNSLKCEQM